MAGHPIRRAREGRLPAPGARGYRWATATAGNTLGQRHGAFSTRKVDPVALELVSGLLEDRPDLERYPEAVWAWGRAEARCLIFDEYLQDHEPWSEAGLKVASWVHRVEGQAQRMRERLGLDPRGEAELLRESAEAQHATFDLDALRARGREAMDARTSETGAPAEVAAPGLVAAEAPEVGGE